MCSPWSTAACISSWTWNGFEGKNCLIEVYSDAPEVELFVNEKSIGKRPCGEENRFRAVFDTTYEPGELRAAAYYMDGTTRTYSLKTAANAVELDVEADRNLIASGDLSYVTIQLQDAAGILHTGTDRRIKISVEGSGYLQGFGSADPYSEENFFDMERMTYYGRALAVVRADETKGTITVKAEAKGVKPVSINIHVK